ncbi:hypothetical protein JXB41_04950 [Candidatus Woesearchaeota archaeon]|nr:hypothetical protein [Candidatus Woesearchaeota archaeon]
MFNIIIRYAEIGTKGKNRKDFELKLVRNIGLFLKSRNIKKYCFNRVQGRIILNTENKKINLTRIFGISSYSYAKETSQELSQIKNNVDLFLDDFTSETKFRVTSKRVDKSFPLSSLELNKEIGEYIINKKKAHVSLKKFNKEIFIELIDKKAYVFDKIIYGLGGLPTGVQGKIFCLIENNESFLSFLSSLLIMKRGSEIVPIGIKGTDINILTEYSPNLKLEIIKSFDDLPELAAKYNIKAIVLPYVMNTLKRIRSNLLQLNPLIGYSVQEIKQMKELYLQNDN